MVGGKFPRSDVVDQLTAVLEKFKETGIEVPADATTEKKPEEEKTEEQKAEEAKAAEGMEGGEREQYEGGEDGGEVKEGEEKKEEEKKEETMQRADPRAAHTDDQEYKGFESTPALYLRTALTSEFFGDSIKQRIVAIEFTGAKGQGVNE